MKSFGTPNKRRSIHYNNAQDEEETTIISSVDRYKKSINDRDRRRQIIAKLAEKRKQYQTGISKAEKESFQKRIKTSIIKHKQLEKKLKNNNINNYKAIKPTHKILINNQDKKEEEEEEHKSTSISRSLSISPIQSKHHIQNMSISNSPCLVHPNGENSLQCKSVRHHDTVTEDRNDIQNNDSLYNDVRDEELRMLKAQNKRLSNKLEHVNTELIETNVFLRSERKRNKNLFKELKLKENEINDLSQHIEELEIEIEEKDKKCVRIVEKLSEYEQKNKHLLEIQNVNKNLSSQIKQNYNEIKEWQNKYYNIFEKYSNSKSKHKQQIKNLNNELSIRNQSETENINKLKQLINSQNIEINKIKNEHEILINNINSITKLMQNQIQSNYNNVSKQLNKMLYNENEYEGNEIQSKINILLQSLIGVIDKSDRLNQHNNELNSCLTKYENDIMDNKNIIINYQQKLTQLQNNFTVLKNEKLESDQKTNETTNELQKVYESIFNITNELQRIVIMVTKKENIGDLNMNQCIEIIVDSVDNNQIKMNKLNGLLNQVTTQYLKQIGSVEQIFKSVTENWSERIHGLQDKLYSLQLVWLRNNGTNNTNLSRISLISDVNKSFGMDNIESQFNEQMILINELKNEINDKQNTIDVLIHKSNNINQPKYTKTIKKLKYENNTLRKERDDALKDFHKIVDEWQNMEKQIDKTYNQNEILQKRLKIFEYYINCINEYIQYKINNPNDNIESYINENICNNMPNIINKLHNSLMHIITRMDLPNVNETIIEDINDDAFLEKLFGNVEQNGTQINEEEYNDKICKLEAKICLEGIINKVELSHVGNKAEKIIIGYQDKLKKYHQFVQQLQNKISQSSKLIHAITLERDHAWTQYKILENEVNSLNKENEILESNVSKDRQELNNKTKQLNELMNEYEIKVDSMKQQLKLDEDTNNNIHQRLNESQLIIQQITKQRNELETKCINITNKFMEYKQNSDMLFKRLFNVMGQSINPFVIKLNEINNIVINKHSILNERMEYINDKIKHCKHYIQNDLKAKEKKHKQDEILKIRKQCETSALKKLRVHADIHRFQFAKLLQEMKQKYLLNMEELKQRINSLQNKFNKIQNSYLTLQNEYKKQNENKILIESQLIQLKKSYNEEIVNYQNVKSSNNEIINNLNKELETNKQIINNLNNNLNEIINENKMNIQKREDIQLQLNEQNKKCRKLHSKAIKFQTELKEIKPKYKHFEEEINELNKLNKSLKETNKSLKESLNTKEFNNNKMNELYNNKINELEIINNKLNNKCNKNEIEINKYIFQIKELEELNNEFINKFESIRNERSQYEKEWFNTEEDLRNEINIIRQQLHSNTNELGIMKLNNLENETEIKKLENEINGLNEEILFYKECEIKNKNEIEILNKQILRNNKSYELKINDIQMILDAKTIRITQLKQEMDNKYNNIKLLNEEIIRLKNEINTNKSLIKNENKILKNKHNENNKLQMIINDLSNELNIIKNEKGKLSKELQTQKNVNVQLSIELDSMQQFKSNNMNETALNVSFYDIDLERNKTSLSMPNMSNISNMDLLNVGHVENYSDNVIKSNNNNNYSNIYLENKNKHNNNKKKRLPGLPIPKTLTSKSSSKLNCSKVLFYNNGEENESVIFDL